MKTADVFSAVAFDMDGLMFNTEDVYWNAADRLLGRRGHRYTRELSDLIMGRPPEFCFTTFKERFGLAESWRELQKESEDIFLDLLRHGFTTMPGLDVLLEHLEKHAIPKCICTSSAHRIADTVLARDGMIDRFRFLLTAEEITHGKPHPEVYLRAAETFGIAAKEMVVLEDSTAGIQAARSAGAYAVAVLAEHNRQNDYSHASLVVEALDASEVLGLFE